MTVIVRPEGSIPAKIMICGEAPGEEEELKGIPFVGASGQELNRMLGEAGIGRNECFITNVCRIRPPKNDINSFIAKAKKDVTSAHVLYKNKHVLPPIIEGVQLLSKEISMVKPNVIIALGNTPLWCLTSVTGITKWRGSMLTSDGDMGRTKVIPTFHPAAVLREWSWRSICVHDLRRARRFREGEPYPQPKWSFIIRPTYSRAVQCLDELLRRLTLGPCRLSFDLETRAGHIACAGISWSLTEAICIPLMCVERREGYWTAEEEYEIICLLQKVLTHPNAQVVGQNILYDSQYTWRHWHFVPNVVQDCMISQHSLFSDLPKSLAYQASMYCDYYVFWKEEGKQI